MDPTAFAYRELDICVHFESEFQAEGAASMQAVAAGKDGTKWPATNAHFCAGFGSIVAL